jgi:NAD dependent epimerase/dehydratase
VEALVARGHRVRAMALYNAFGSYGWLDSLAPDVLEHVEVQLGDVRDPRSVTELMRDARRVFHLAALIGIPYSYSAPSSYLATNAGGTLNVLEAARTLGTERVIVTSTSEVYGTARSVPIDESHPLQGQSPYSASKIAADKLAQSYQLSFSTPVVTLRPFNTYGPRQSARAVIPTVITQLATGQREVHIGATRPTRDFVYVADTVAAFLAVAEADAERVVGRELNAATGREIAIGDLVGIIAGIMERPFEIVSDDERLRPDASEVMRLLGDASALRAQTGWAPSVALEDGLRRTVAWFSDPANLARFKPGSYNV